MKLHRIKTKLNKEDFYRILLVMVWTRTILTSYAYQTLLRLPLISEFALEIKYFAYILVILFAMKSLRSRFRLADYCFGFICLVGFFVNLSVFPSTSEYLLRNCVNIICISFAAYYIGVSMNKDEYIDLLYKWSKICIYTILLYFVVFGFQSEAGRVEAENMGVAYRILPHLVMVLFFALRNRRRSDIIASIIGFVLLLACGTRGPVVATVLFIVIYIAFFMKFKWKFLIVFVLGVCAIILAFSPSILLSPLSSTLKYFGFSTRVVDAFISGTLSDDNGRNEISFTMLNLLKQNGYKGFGLAGDRGIVSWMAYSHNIVIELMMTFGSYIGVAVFGLIVFIILRALITANEIERVFIISMIFGGSFFKLFFTSSFLIEYQFFLMMGYCICVIRKKRGV